MTNVYYIPQTTDEIVKYCRMGLADLQFRPGIIMPPGARIIQPKMDGWWVALQCKSGMCTVITSGADPRASFPWDIPDCLLIAEWMYGTNWSARFAGKFFVHDVLYWSETYWGDRPYGERLQALRLGMAMFPAPNVELIRSLTLREDELHTPLDAIWKEWVIDADYEGLVLKSPDMPFGAKGQAQRMKRTYTLDFIATDFVLGGGKHARRLGSMQGSQYDENGELKVITWVGTGYDDADREEIWTNREQYRGKVFEVFAWGLFPGGAPRHPGFVRWREDKLPENCRIQRPQ